MNIFIIDFKHIFNVIIITIKIKHIYLEIVKGLSTSLKN